MSDGTGETRQERAEREALARLDAEEERARARKATGPAGQQVGAPAGWYPHPSMANTLRYWDGQRWTDQVAPGPAPAPVRVEKHGGPGVVTIAAGILLAVFVMWFIYSMEHSNDDLDCANQNAERAMNGQPLLDCGN